MNEKANLYNFTFDELAGILADFGEPKFRARQIWDWLARGAGSYDEMTNLPGGLREFTPTTYPWCGILWLRERASCFESQGRTDVSTRTDCCSRPPAYAVSDPTARQF